MTITSKAKKIIKAIGFGLIGVVTFLFVVLSGVVSKRDRQIKEYKKTIAGYEQTIREKNEMIATLAAMEAVHCEVAIPVKNTAVMGTTSMGDIKQDAYQVATYLRGEILEELKKKQ